MKEINKILNLNVKDFGRIRNMLDIGKFTLKEFFELIDFKSFKAVQLADILTEEKDKLIYNDIINSFRISPLIFLGIGSAFNPLENSNSAMIKTGNHLLLIDCGESTFKTLIKNNILNDVKSVDILTTHMHGDHIGSLSTLIHYLFLIKNIKANIYFPSNELKEFLILSNNQEDTYNYIKIDKKEKLLDNLYVEPFTVKHIENTNSFGYEIEYNDRTIIYTGDSAELPHNINDKLSNKENITLYQDVSLYDVKAHFYYKDLIKEINKDVTHKVFAMHLDNREETFEKLKRYNFNVVKNILK